MIDHVLQGVVVALVLVKLYALGRKWRWGWMCAAFAEAPWLALAIRWNSWGMVALSVLYGGFALVNFVRWGEP